PIDDIRIWNRTRANAETVAEKLKADGLNVAVADDLDEAVGWADIVSSATISDKPLVKGAHLRPGTHVDLVGAFTPALRESDDETVRKARVYVDTRAGATKEAGDIVQALASGALAADGIVGDLFAIGRAACGETVERPGAADPRD